MSKKLFLLETDEALNGQLVSYLKNFFDINLENFDSAENLFKASVSKQPEIILFGIDSNSKKLFPKLASFKNSFNTKLIAIVFPKRIMKNRNYHHQNKTKTGEEQLLKKKAIRISKISFRIKNARRINKKQT